MKIKNLDQKILNWEDGKPLKDEAGILLTFAIIYCRALRLCPTRGLTLEEATHRDDLARKIFDAKTEIDLPFDDVKRIRDSMQGFGFPAIITGPASKNLEGQELKTPDPGAPK